MASVKRIKKSIHEDQEMDMTPMIDCVFLLLIFFMITTVFKNPQRLTLNIPKGDNPETLEQRQIVCEVNAEGEIAINGKDTSLDSFDAELIQQKQEMDSKSLYIKADEGAKHGTILQLMRIAKEVQIENIAIAMEDANPE